MSLNAQQQKFLMQTIPERAYDDGTAKNSKLRRYDNNNYTFEDIEKMDYKDLNKATLTARVQDNGGLKTQKGKQKGTSSTQPQVQRSEDGEFTPRDIIDYDENDEEDEVLRKFRKDEELRGMKEVMRAS